MPKEIATVFIFESDSSPGRTYQTILYVDGSTSCECKGWVFKRRTTPGNERTCKHTRYVDAGLANRHAVKMVEYATPTPTPRRPQRAMETPLLRPDPLARVGRRFDFEAEAA